MTQSETQAVEAVEALYRQERQEREERIYNRIVKTVFQSQLLLTLIVGLGFFLLSMIVAQTMIHAASEEIKSIIEANRCTCGQNNRANASGNTVTILPDPNSDGALKREYMVKKGLINGDVSGASSTAQ